MLKAMQHNLSYIYIKTGTNDFIHTNILIMSLHFTAISYNQTIGTYHTILGQAFFIVCQSIHIVSATRGERVLMEEKESVR